MTYPHTKLARYLLLAFALVCIAITAMHYMPKRSPKAGYIGTDSTDRLEKQFVQHQTKIDSLNEKIHRIPTVRTDSARRAFWQ